MPYINSDPGYSLPDADKIIWRYMDFDKFLNLITTSKLFFCRIDKYPDKFEGVNPAAHYSEEFFRRYYVRFNYNSAQVNDIVNQELLMAKWNYYKKRCQYMINCWNEGKKESEALWKVYAGFERGIVIQSTIAKLCDSFTSTTDEIHIGKVQYIDHLDNSIIVNQNFKSHLVKDESYSYENEIRCVYYDSNMDEENESAGKLIDVDTSKLISKVYISPKINKIVFDNLKAVLRNHHFDLELSKLYEKPNFV